VRRPDAGAARPMPGGRQLRPRSAGRREPRGALCVSDQDLRVPGFGQALATTPIPSLQKYAHLVEVAGEAEKMRKALESALASEPPEKRSRRGAGQPMEPPHRSNPRGAGGHRG